MNIPGCTGCFHAVPKHIAHTHDEMWNIFLNVTFLYVFRHVKW